jgi:hypothetical protein
VLDRARRSYWGGVGHVPPIEQVLASIRSQRAVRTGLRDGYGAGPLTQDLLGPGGVAAGERAPDVRLAGPDGRTHRLYGLLRHGGWTLLAFPDGMAQIHTAAVACAAARGVLTYEVVRQPDAHPGHLVDPLDALRLAYVGGRSGLCLLRPDGFVGFRGGLADLASLRAYLGRVCR